MDTVICFSGFIHQCVFPGTNGSSRVMAFFLYWDCLVCNCPIGKHYGQVGLSQANELVWAVSVAKI